MNVVTRIFPFLEWVKGYRTGHLRADLISGITVALVLIPQSMAYAQLAGLPVYYGLYASFLPPMVAALFGSSRQLATGPVAVVSLMTAAALEPLARAGSAEYVAYAILLALVVGAVQFVLGVLRLGLVVNFLSHPVINGFTNAAALIIATSQLSKLFGVAERQGEHQYVTVYNVLVDAIDYTHWPTVGMAALSIAIMITLRRVNRKIPNVLVAVLATTVLSFAVGFEKNRTVDVASLGSPEVHDLVLDYNEIVAKRSKAEALRSELNKNGGLAAQVQGGACTSCHSEPEGGLIPGQGTGEIKVSPEKAMALHHSAGLIDLYIGELKEHGEHYQDELKHVKLTLAEAPGGGFKFFLRGEVPQGYSPEKGIWRIKVKNAPFTLDGIPLVGGGAVVGGIPKGLPTLALPEVNGNVLRQLLLVGAIISLLGFMEAISIAKAMAARTQQRLDPNQELIGQGLANLVGCASHAYAVSGSFSRSAVNLQGGAVSGFSNVFSSAVVVLTLLFLTPLLYHLPQAVLASIIMMAVIGLLNVRGFVHAWQANRFDGITAVVCFFTTLAFAPHLEFGIAIGVALSLGAYLYRSMRPHVAELALHPDGSMRDAARHGLGLCRRIAAVRFDGSLNFANASYLEDEILTRVADSPHLRYVLIAAHGINDMDASGEEMLSHVVDRLRGAGYEVVFSGLKENVMDVMRRTRLYEKIGEKNMYPTQAMAVTAIHSKAHAGSDEKECPLLMVVPHGGER
jgi:SulP family sulfate permease